jgi:hypothetical protein
MLETRFSLVAVGGDAGCTELPARIVPRSDASRPDPASAAGIPENATEGERAAADWRWQQIHKWFCRGRGAS